MRTTTTLGEMEVTLQPPDSYTTCYDIWLGTIENQRRAVGAALGLCWVGPKRKAPGGRYRYDLMGYGGQVIDDLQRQGYSMSEIVAAGTAAYNLVCSTLPELATDDEPSEVDQAEGFSEDPANSTSS